MAADDLSLAVADLADLKAFTFFASENMDKLSVAPGESIEQIARLFYGDFVFSICRRQSSLYVEQGDVWRDPTLRGLPSDC